MFLFKNTKEQIRELLELMVVGERLEELLELDVIQDYISENYISKDDYIINLNKLEVILKKESTRLAEDNSRLKAEVTKLEGYILKENGSKLEKEREKRELKYKLMDHVSMYHRFTVVYNKRIDTEGGYHYIVELATICNMSVIEFLYSDLIKEVMNKKSIDEYKKDFELKLAESYSKEEARRMRKRNIKMSIDHNELALKNLNTSIENNNKEILKYNEEIKKLNEDLKKLEELEDVK